MDVAVTESREEAGAMDWYYADEAGQRGPVSADVLQELIAAGGVNPDTLVWHDGMDDWLPLASIPELSAVVPASTPEVGRALDVPGTPCTSCGTPYAESDMIAYEGTWVCGECKDDFFQRLREGGATGSGLEFASVWRRGWARIIDGILVNGCVYAVFFGVMFLAVGVDQTGSTGAAEDLLGIFMVGLSFAVPMAYDTWFIGKYGQTPGKKLLGIRVVRSDGSALGYGRAFGRFWGYVVSRTIAYIGCIMALFDSEKRSLHDHLCDTRVVKS